LPAAIITQLSSLGGGPSHYLKASQDALSKTVDALQKTLDDNHAEVTKNHGTLLTTVENLGTKLAGFLEGGKSKSKKDD